MEYVIGIVNDKQVLKTVAREHTDFKGWCTLVRETDVDQTTATFKVVKKLHQAEDLAGNCYDWYEIDKYNSVVEHGNRVHRLEEQAATIETAMCDTDAENEERLAEIELALCELDERG